VHLGSQNKSIAHDARAQSKPRFLLSSDFRRPAVFFIFLMLVISSSADHTLRTWDARAGALVREHKGHEEPINGAALGQGGEIVVSAGDDGACLVFGTE